MDVTGVLESIAGLLATLPEESVEDLLVNFDGLVAVGDEGTRPAAAALLRKSAAAAPDAARRERLLRAAESMAAGQPCALTASRLTAQQASAAQTITAEEWEKQSAGVPPAPASEEIEADYMEDEPPQFPRLRVRHFFPGLLVRVARDFGDARGRAVCSGELLEVRSCEPAGEGYEIAARGRRIELREDSILENAGNAWFQPVPSEECIDALIVALTRAIDSRTEEDEDEVEELEMLRQDVETCEEWLGQSGARGPAPRNRNPRLAARVFGRDHEVAAWMAMLFACVGGDEQLDAEPEPAPFGPEYRAFLASMEISYGDWRDGAGYDLDALAGIADGDRPAAVAVLTDRLAATPNWRDVEALGVIGTPAAREAIRGAMARADSDTRMRAAEVLASLGEPVDLEGVIVEALRGSGLGSGLSRAIDLAAENPGPRIQETLLDLALKGNRDQRIHCAALALYLGGKAAEAFDWNHRPFFLRFGEEDRATQIAAYRELCERLDVPPQAAGDAR